MGKIMTEDHNNIAKTYEVKMKDYTGPMIYESPDGGKTVRARPMIEPKSIPDYKFNEGDLIDEFKEYIDSTYNGHYSKNNFQATEFIIDGGHGIGFALGNVMKYAQRYGKKGTDEDARKDLMKVLHYALIALYTHDSTKNT
tara:strand:+ start:835 stop:1257 length:423 start_codon:yes stop_codon:yes gene_type:complete